MATKPLLPEVIAERAKAADDYRNAHQAAIDRIEKLRAARLQRDAEMDAAKSESAPARKTGIRSSSKGEKAESDNAAREKVASARANAATGA